MELTKIIVIDDHPLLRDGVVSTLNGSPDLDVIGEGGSYDEAVALVKNCAADLMMLDLSIPGGGLQALADIRNQSPDLKIVVLTASEEERDVQKAIDLGASAYILKGISGTELVDAVTRVSAGETYVTPHLATSLLSRKSVQDYGLTQRERDILTALKDGLSNKDIAARLSLSEKTIKHYMTQVLSKLGVKNRVEAALMAEREGIE
ncbi:MAG: response regulator [bacterium]